MRRAESSTLEAVSCFSRTTSKRSLFPPFLSMRHLKVRSWTLMLVIKRMSYSKTDKILTLFCKVCSPTGCTELQMLSFRLSFVRFIKFCKRGAFRKNYSNHKVLRQKSFSRLISSSVLRFWLRTQDRRGLPV